MDDPINDRSCLDRIMRCEKFQCLIERTEPNRQPRSKIKTSRRTGKSGMTRKTRRKQTPTHVTLRNKRKISLFFFCSNEFNDVRYSSFFFFFALILDLFSKLYQVFFLIRVKSRESFRVDAIFEKFSFRQIELPLRSHRECENVTSGAYRVKALKCEFVFARSIKSRSSLWKIYRRETKNITPYSSMQKNF